MRDPKGVVPYMTYDPADGLVEIDAEYDDDVDVPDDARDTGYHSSEFHLFISDSSIDEVIYVQTDDGMERWPRSEAGCA